MSVSNNIFGDGSRINGFDKISRPFLIGVGGGTASGKSTVCRKIMEALGQLDVDQKKKQVVIVSMDSFYRALSAQEQEQAKHGLFNFDHPNALDDDFMYSILRKVKAGETVKVPTYDTINQCRRAESEWKHIDNADVILVEGILTFYFPLVKNLFDMKLFVDTDADTRLSRRVLRDLKELNRGLEQILNQYTSFVKPAFEDFCLPTKKYADVIIPRGADNLVAIDLIVQHIQDLLRLGRNQQSKRLRHDSENTLHKLSTPH